MCASTLRRLKRPRSPPGTPVPHTTEVISLTKQRAYPPASPTSTQKIRHFRQQLLNMPELRSEASTSNLDASDHAGSSGIGPPCHHLYTLRQTRLLRTGSRPSTRTTSKSTHHLVADLLLVARRHLIWRMPRDETHANVAANGDAATTSSCCPRHPLNPPEDPNFN